MRLRGLRMLDADHASMQFETSDGEAIRVLEERRRAELEGRNPAR